MTAPQGQSAIPSGGQDENFALPGRRVFLGVDRPLRLDCGVELSNFPVAFQTYGTLNAARSNAILVCHALTGDQFVAEPHPVTGKQGWWEIMVETPGEYEFDLRRWPEEAGHWVRSGIEGKDVVYREDGILPAAKQTYSGGVALDIDTAGLDVSGLPSKWVSVSPEDRGAIIRMSLPAGPRHVRAQFSGANGFYTSAYYVYVKRVG